MTVCAAAICRWTYSEGDEGPCIITASDRMLTDEQLGIEYETNQGKFAYIAKRVMVLVADNLTMHTELLHRIRKNTAKNPDMTVEEAAQTYAKHLREFRATRAAELNLAPLGLDLKSFARDNKKLDGGLAIELAKQLQDYEMKAEALVVGVQDSGAHIYYVSGRGLVTCYDDVGFASIGIGNIHANSQFMVHGYTNTWPYFPALLLLYSSKKRAEIAPGVGKLTNLNFVNREGCYYVHKRVFDALEKIFQKYEKARATLERKALADLLKEHSKILIEEAAKKPPRSSTPPALPAPKGQ